MTSQNHAARLAMWLFLGSELLLFAGLFALYTAYRAEYPREFAAGIEHDALALGSTNTVVLIVSSFTVATAVHCVRIDRRRASMIALVATLLLGTTFLVLKGVEYSQHFAEGFFPGTNLFFTLYFFMTGLHALHMVAGLIVMGWLTVRLARRHMDPAYHPELELGALYWHLVDSIWIFLWPLFYLAG